MNPDLVKVTEIFLAPTSFLVAALGTAGNNLLKTGVSTLGLAVSLLWLICSIDAIRSAAAEKTAPESAHTTRSRVLVGLPTFFIAVWILSAVFHAWEWGHPGPS